MYNTSVSTGVAKVSKAMGQHPNIKAHVGAITNTMHVVAHTKLKMLFNTPYRKLEKCTEQARLKLQWKHTWLQL